LSVVFVSAAFADNARLAALFAEKLAFPTGSNDLLRLAAA